MQNLSVTDIGLLMLMCLAIGVMLTLIGVFLGSFITYRGFKAGTGSPEGFFGTIPKGEVFNIIEPEAATGLAPEDDESVSHLMNNTNRFLQILKGAVK